MSVESPAHPPFTGTGNQANQACHAGSSIVPHILLSILDRSGRPHVTAAIHTTIEITRDARPAPNIMGNIPKSG